MFLWRWKRMWLTVCIRCSRGDCGVCSGATAICKQRCSHKDETAVEPVSLPRPPSAESKHAAIHRGRGAALRAALHQSPSPPSIGSGPLMSIRPSTVSPLQPLQGLSRETKQNKAKQGVADHRGGRSTWFRPGGEDEVQVMGRREEARERLVWGDPRHSYAGSVTAGG